MTRAVPRFDNISVLPALNEPSSTRGPSISFEPVGPDTGAVVSQRQNGIAYHELELFIWRLRETVPNPHLPMDPPNVVGAGSGAFRDGAGRQPLEDWVHRLRQLYGRPIDAALAINDSLRRDNMPISFSPDRVYRFTNNAAGPEMALAFDPTTGRLTMLPIGSSPTQLWFFALRANSSPPGPSYWLRNVVRGDDSSLDVINDNDRDSRTLSIKPTGRYTGQFWTARRWNNGGPSEGTENRRQHVDIRLTNDFTGSQRCLSVDSTAVGFEAMLRDITDDAGGMHWTIADVGELALIRGNVED